MGHHVARKRFGQNFLQDSKVIFDIVNAVSPNKTDVVIEIGPGLGALTRPLTDKLDSLHVIEIDRDIVSNLKKTPYKDKLHIHAGDVLKFDFSTIVGQKKIVGNLPYNISTPLLFHLAQTTTDVVDMHFMLQKEVIDRMVSEPNTADYGRLSVMLQYFYEMESLFIVPPEAFSPAPKVQSAVVRMIPNSGRVGFADNFDFFQKLVTKAFSQRRKTVRNTLKELVTEEELLACDISPDIRAENISPEQFVRLSNYVFARRE